MREDDRENQPSPDLETPALAQSTMTPKVASFLLLLAESSMGIQLCKVEVFSSSASFLGPTSGVLYELRPELAINL